MGLSKSEKRRLRTATRLWHLNRYPSPTPRSPGAPKEASHKVQKTFYGYQARQHSHFGCLGPSVFPSDNRDSIGHWHRRPAQNSWHQKVSRRNAFRHWIPESPTTIPKRPGRPPKTPKSLPLVQNLWEICFSPQNNYFKVAVICFPLKSQVSKLETCVFPSKPKFQSWEFRLLPQTYIPKFEIGFLRNRTNTSTLEIFFLIETAKSKVELVVSFSKQNVKVWDSCWLIKTQRSKLEICVLSSKPKCQHWETCFIFKTQFQSWKYVFPPSTKESNWKDVRPHQNQNSHFWKHAIFIKTKVSKLHIFVCASKPTFENRKYLLFLSKPRFQKCRYLPFQNQKVFSFYVCF